MNFIPKKKAKSRKFSNNTKELTYFDDFLLSNLISKEKLLELVDLANISRQTVETKASLCMKIMYESTYGLDELLDLCFDNNQLIEICNMLDLDTSNNNRAHLIGMIVEVLPSRKKRKVTTIIEEEIEEDFHKARIYNLFMIYFDGRCLFSFNPEPLDVGDSQLISSALNAISHLMIKITKSEERLKHIDLGDKKLIFEYGNMEIPNPMMPGSPPNYLVGVLLVNQETTQMKEFLKEFIKKFETRYKDILVPNWDGNTDVFISAYELVDESLRSTNN